MKELIFKNIQKNRYSIYSLFLAFIICYMTISEKFFYNYLVLLLCIISLFLILSIYIKVELEYFYVSGFFVIICTLGLFLLGRQSIGIRFIYFSILISFLGFFVKYFYKFCEAIEKSGRKRLIDTGFLILSIIIIFSSVLGFINYRNKIKLSEKNYEEAIHFYNDRDYYKAINLLNKSITFNRLNFEAYNLLGRSYLKIEKLRESEKNLIHAINLKSDYFDPIIALGTTYEKENEFNRAIKIYEKAKKMKPGDFGAYFGLGRAYYKIGDLENSLVALLKAEKIDSTSYELQYLLGSIYYEKNLFIEALDHFNLIKNRDIPKGIKIENGKKVQDYIEEITKKLEI